MNRNFIINFKNNNSSSLLTIRRCRFKMAASVEDMPVVKHSVHTLIFRSLKRTHDMFLSEEGQPLQEDQKA